LPWAAAAAAGESEAVVAFARKLVRLPCCCRVAWWATGAFIPGDQASDGSARKARLTPRVGGGRPPAHRGGAARGWEWRVGPLDSAPVTGGVGSNGTGTSAQWARRVRWVVSFGATRCMTVGSVYVGPQCQLLRWR
jgi:hypothetical protein